MVRTMEVYDINDSLLTTDEQPAPLGHAETGQEAIEVWKKAQSKETLASNYVITANVHNGEWVVELADRD